jgi:hypothetical protein
MDEYAVVGVDMDEYAVVDGVLIVGYAGVAGEAE